MPISILMPALSPTMEEGTLSRWLVKEGDTVASGDVIAEIETDKATMEVEAVEEGKVGKILVGEGTTNVAVNVPIAVLLEEGEDASALSGFEAASPAPATAAAAPEPSPTVAPEPAPVPTPAAAPAPTPKSNGQAGRIFASPLARRLAAQNDIELAALTGSGPHGRIVKRDIEAAIEQGVPAPAAAPASAAEATPAAGVPAVAPAVSDESILALYEPGTYEVVPHDNMRKIIASRLTEAKQTIPHFYLSIDCELDALLAARRRLNAMSPDDGPKTFKISVNDLVIKAMAMALQKVPAANATWTNEGILRHKTSDIGVAVAIEGGLFTPVIRHAEVKSLSEISNEMRDLAERARNRRLAPHEYQGGTTSISNLGMFGIKKFDAVINPPHASILAVGAGEKRPVISGDEIKVATMMSVTLSCDHRVIDGALGAELLDAFKGFIEEPVTMLV
ncbi:MAG: pyruvate dehydrogenase complex dihydrolipoamide acetyltransferase [Hyphomicrobiales bacterium]|nr:pyruvate dehydrogenase complex dihydrolipoamide acetyltransferase [Hyphomicrobiales bacterium]